ncbi:MAG: NAD(P)/FAD-dependent oxidoreductase [Bacillota bacterium]
MDIKLYDVIIVGGGPGGLQAAIQLGRYRWKTLVIDRGKARAFFVPRYMNVIGYPEGIPGRELLKTGRAQAEMYGVEFLTRVVTRVTKDEDGLFTVTAQHKPDYKAGNAENIETFRCRKLILSTGVMDRHPDVPNVFYWAGHAIYYCPDCDGYEVTDKKVVVVGRGNGAAGLALTLINWTGRIQAVNIDPERPVSQEWLDKLAVYNIPVFTGKLKEFIGERRDTVEKVILEDGTELEAEKVFSALGKYSVNSELAVALGVETLPNGHIVVDPRTKETRIEGVWAVGDVVAYHPQQVTISIGEGAQAGIWINKKLRAEGLLPQAAGKQ